MVLLTKIVPYFNENKGEAGSKMKTKLVCQWCERPFWSFRSDSKTCSASHRQMLYMKNKLR